MSVSALAEKLRDLKEKRNAVLLVHNYQVPEVQECADFIGDSLALAIAATKSNAEVIVFCGVDFMAETAAILNPECIVVHPVRSARCPMAAMVSVNALKALKKKHPEAAVVSYVNTTAETKALSDVCCTSANAVEVVRRLPNEVVIFLPDKNLAHWVQQKVPEKKIIPWEGYCYVHQDIIDLGVMEFLMREHPRAEVLVHPECVPEVVALADHVLSTEGMVRHVRNSPAQEFIIGTERELCYRLRKENPTKTVYPVPNAVCRAMKQITLEKVVGALARLEPRVTLSEKLTAPARAALMRMLGR
jgi:quinolinate synthase